jgi:hypothetical protein
MIEQASADYNTKYHITQQGAVVSVRLAKSGVPSKVKGGGLRGAVVGFSKASRRRLLHLMNRMDTRGIRTSFLTLTFASAKTTAKAAKAALKRFTERVKYKYGASVSWIWRLEFQERGAPHFHLITFGLPFIKQAQLQTIWTQCTKEELSIVHIQRVKNSKHLISYVAKYIAKLADKPAPTEADKPTSQQSAYLDIGTYQQNDPEANRQGRLWGFYNEEGLPYAIQRKAIVSGQIIGYLSWFADAVSKGKARARYHDTFSVFSDATFRLWLVLKRDADSIEDLTPEHLSSSNPRRDAISQSDRQTYCAPYKFVTSSN